MKKIMEGDKEMNRILYWINTIKARVPNNPQFLFVGTHLDAFEESKMDYDQFVSLIEEKTKINRDCIVGISSQTGKNVDRLIEIMEIQGLEIPMIKDVFPKMYLDLKVKIEKLSKEIQPPIMKWEEFREKSIECNMSDQELIRASNFLHILGFCLYYEKEKVSNFYYYFHFFFETRKIIYV